MAEFDEPLVANHRDFGRRAVFHHIEQGDDAVERKLDMAIFPQIRFLDL
jgi:hypothetical protein